jgi:glycosyltransferase involved in cell wall biosynthesis
MSDMTRTVALITSGAYTLPNFRGSLISLLVKQGVRVIALAPDHTDAIRVRLRAMGAEPMDFSLSRTGLNPWRDGMDLVRLVRQLRALKPDATLCYFAKPVIYGGLAAAMAGVPRRIGMIEGLGYLFGDERRGLRHRLIRGITERLYRAASVRAHGTLFLNTEDRDLFVTRGIVPINKAFNIGAIGVELEKFSVSIADTPPVSFLLMARLLREKGIEQFVAAARLLRPSFPNTRFLVLGGLDDNPTSVSEAEMTGWVDEGLIEWHGHIEDIRPVLAESSVFVLPSYYREGVPRSIQEAMASGKPIITTDHVGCRDTVDPGVNGFLVPIRDSNALAEAMRRFLLQPGLIQKMGIASRKIAEERFDARRIDELLANMLLKL